MKKITATILLLYISLFLFCGKKTLDFNTCFTYDKTLGDPLPEDETSIEEDPGGGKIFLAGATDVAVDNRDHVYVINSAMLTLDKFDSDGNHLYRQEFEKGRGPGEFHYMSSLTTDSEGLIYILDEGQRRVSVFKEREFTYSFNTNLRIRRIRDLPGAGITGTIFDMSGSKKDLFCMYGYDGKVIKEFGEKFPAAKEWGIIQMHVSNNKVYGAGSGGFEIGLYNKDLPVFIYEGDRETSPPVIKERGQAVSISFPFSITGLSVYDKKLYVTSFQRGKSETDISKNYLDIFDQETGEILSTIQMDQNNSLRAVDSRGRFYFLDRKSLKRYTLN